MSIAREILRALEKRVTIDYEGLFEEEVLAIIDQVLRNSEGCIYNHNHLSEPDKCVYLGS